MRGIQKYHVMHAFSLPSSKKVANNTLLAPRRGSRQSRLWEDGLKRIIMLEHFFKMYVLEITQHHRLMIDNSVWGRICAFKDKSPSVSPRTEL